MQCNASLHGQDAVTVATCSTPRSQVPVHLLLVVRHRIQPRMRQWAATFVSAVYLTNRTIVREAAGRRDTRAALKTRRNSQSQTGSGYSFLVLQQGASISLHSCLIYGC